MASLVEIEKVQTYDLEVKKANFIIEKAVWGKVGGDISNQTDLQTELEKKAGKDTVYTKSETDDKYATKIQLESYSTTEENDAKYQPVGDYATRDDFNDIDAKVNEAAANANEKAGLAEAAADRVDKAIENANSKAVLANEAAENANQKASLADNATAKATSAADLATSKAALANEAAENAKTQADRAKSYSDNPPKINDNSYWEIYDEVSGAYVNTEVYAKGHSGVYVGSGEMPENCNVQIDLEGEVLSEDDIVTKEYLANNVYTKAEIDALLDSIYNNRL